MFQFEFFEMGRIRITDCSTGVELAGGDNCDGYKRIYECVTDSFATAVKWAASLERLDSDFLEYASMIARAERDQREIERRRAINLKAENRNEDTFCGANQ